MGFNKILLTFGTKLSIALLIFTTWAFSNLDAQNTAPIKWKLNEDGSRYFQMTFLNQAWVRYNQHNDGTTIESEASKSGFDTGLRRTRIVPVCGPGLATPWWRTGRGVSHRPPNMPIARR